jgi:hypothetical protein
MLEIDFDISFTDFDKFSNCLNCLIPDEWYSQGCCKIEECLTDSNHRVCKVCSKRRTEPKSTTKIFDNIEYIRYIPQKRVMKNCVCEVTRNSERYDENNENKGIEENIARFEFLRAFWISVSHLFSP